MTLLFFEWAFFLHKKKVCLTFASMNREITISYSEITERCKMLSAYEGQTNFAENGEVLFSHTLITSQEEDLLVSYINEGMEQIKALLKHRVNSVEYKETYVKIEIECDSTRTDEDISNVLNEALVTYAMKQWCQLKKNSKIELYTTLWQTEQLAVVTITNKKGRPARPTPTPSPTPTPDDNN